jgi:hypothetical protein
LLEAALDLAGRHTTFLYGSVQIASRAKFHDLTPLVILVLNKINGLDNVDMVQGGGDAKFCSEFLDIFFFCFVLAAFAEFLEESGMRDQSVR